MNKGCLYMGTANVKGKIVRKKPSPDFAKFAWYRFSTIRHAGLVRATELQFSGLLKLSYYIQPPQKVPDRLINGAARGRRSWYIVSKIGPWGTKIPVFPYISSVEQNLTAVFCTPQKHPKRRLRAKLGKVLTTTFWAMTPKYIQLWAPLTPDWGQISARSLRRSLGGDGL